MSRMPGRLTLQQHEPLQLANTLKSSIVFYERLINDASLLGLVPTGAGTFSEAFFPEMNVIISPTLALQNYCIDFWLVSVDGVPTLGYGDLNFNEVTRSNGVVTHTNTTTSKSVTIQNLYGLPQNDSTIPHIYTSTTDLGLAPPYTAIHLGSAQIMDTQGNIVMSPQPPAVDGGAIAQCGLVNGPNRVQMSFLSRDANPGWQTTSTGNTDPRVLHEAMENFGLNRVVWLDPFGDQIPRIEAKYGYVGSDSSHPGFLIVGIGINTTTGSGSGSGNFGAYVEQDQVNTPGNEGGGACRAEWQPLAPLPGVNYGQAIETSDGYTVISGSDYGFIRLWLQA